MSRLQTSGGPILHSYWIPCPTSLRAPKYKDRPELAGFFAQSLSIDFAPICPVRQMQCCSYYKATRLLFRAKTEQQQQQQQNMPVWLSKMVLAAAVLHILLETGTE
jgi:hypothetical protein